MNAPALLEHARTTLRLLNTATSKGRYLKTWERKLFHSALKALGKTDTDVKHALNSMNHDKCSHCKDTVVAFSAGAGYVGWCISCDVTSPLVTK